MVVFGMDQGFHFADGTVEGSQIFHFQAGDCRRPDASFARSHGEAHGNIRTDAGIAAPTAPIQACRIKIHLMEFAIRINEQTVLVGQDDFPGSHIGVEFGGFEDIGFAGEEFRFDGIAFDHIHMRQGGLHFIPGFIFQFHAAQDTHKTLHIGSDEHVFIFECADDIHPHFASQAGTDHSGFGIDVFHITGCDRASRTGDRKVADVGVGGRIFEFHQAWSEECRWQNNQCQPG